MLTLRMSMQHDIFLLANFLLSEFPFTDNRHQEAKVPVAIRILDVNDNAPKFADHYEGFICESDQTKPLSNQVRLPSQLLARSNVFESLFL